MSGKLIVFESIDGAGKGTQLAKTLHWLNQKIGAENVVATKEPGGTPFGLQVRTLLYEGVPMATLSPGVVDLMFLASHVQNWEAVVKPALLAGKVVLSDRWWYSQAAYQTQRPVPQPVKVAYRDMAGGHADLLLFLSADVDVALGRARNRETETHQSAKMWNDLEVQKKIQDEYYRQFNKYKEWRRVETQGLDAEQVFAKIQRIIWEDLGL